MWLIRTQAFGPSDTQFFQTQSLPKLTLKMDGKHRASRPAYLNATICMTQGPAWFSIAVAA